MEDEEPRLHLLRIGELPGADAHREELRLTRLEARRRHHEHLCAVLDAGGVPNPVAPLVDLVLDTLFSWRDVEGGEPCACSCHPHLPDSDLHDYGFGCSCSKAAEDRCSDRRRSLAGIDAFWASPKGEELTRRRQQQEDELAAWVAGDPGVIVRSHGGMAPEQWTGEVDGHSFYFRERGDHWRIELDLRPSGRYVDTWSGGDLSDPASFQPREIDEGDVITEGTTAERGYGSDPVERAAFIVDVIRTHIRRRACELHTTHRRELMAMFDDEIGWCPACGERLAERDPR